MGDLERESFVHAWHGERFQALRRASLAEDVTGTVCEKCIAYDSTPRPHPVSLVRAAGRGN
jgi:hypothetical protein